MNSIKDESLAESANISGPESVDFSISTIAETLSTSSSVLLSDLKDAFALSWNLSRGICYKVLSFCMKAAFST